MTVRKIVSTIAVFAALAGPARAGTDFGTEEQAKAMADKVIAMVGAQGADTVAGALRDKSTEIGGSAMGVVLEKVEGDSMTVIAHNKFPEISNMDFTQMQDLRGNYLLKDFKIAADKGGADVKNYWPHYTSGQEYEYDCFTKWIKPNDLMITVCR